MSALTTPTPREVVAMAIDPVAWSDCDDYPTARHARPKDQEYARRSADAILVALAAAGFAVRSDADVAAMLAQARREGIEAAAELIEQHSQVCEPETVEGRMVQVVRHLTSGEQAAAIRALLPAPDADD